MIDELRKWMPFNPSAKAWNDNATCGQVLLLAQVVCFGVTYDASDEAQREAFMEAAGRTASSRQTESRSFWSR